MHPPPAGHFALHMLDVGQGESVLLDLPNGDFALIDAGPPKAAEMILPLLAARRHQKRTFRFAAMTHWDIDHIGALSQVLRACPPIELVRPSVDLSLFERICAC